MGKYIVYILLITLLQAGLLPEPAGAQTHKPAFRVLALAEASSIHAPFVLAAKAWLGQLSLDQNITIDYITTTDSVSTTLLNRYQLVIQLDYPPYGWPAPAQTAFKTYIEQGHGGWVGFHHATLLGEFDGYPMWPWFSTFMGGIRYTDYIPGFATATVRVEDRQHPVMQGVTPSFVVEKEEWYTYSKSPRPGVRVLAAVDESTYRPDSDKKMGDHPVIWTNEHMKARNVYIFMGHHPDLLGNVAFTTIVRNAIFWAANTPVNH